MAGEKKVAKDTYLFRDGDAPDAMYIIKSGGFAITKTKGAAEISLAEIGPGAMVGEMALFDRKPRSANVKALKDSEVIALPYDALSAQLESLPVWVRAIMKTMNENLRDANKKIKILENPNQSDDDRYPPYVINRLLSIINFVGHRYGVKEGDGLSLPPARLRNFTIQVFQEATNKMTAMTNALKEMGLMTIEDLGEGKQKIVNLQPQKLFDFVDWYNDWLFKQEKDRTAPINADETRILGALVHFAKSLPNDAKGQRKINLGNVQNESMKELGFVVKPEEVNSLIEKKLVSEKMMDASSIMVTISFSELEPLYSNWKIIWDLKKLLK